MVVVPLKRQRGGKFHNPWEDPDQMNLDEVRLAEITLSTRQRRKCEVTACWEHVLELPVRKNFNSHLRQQFNHV